MLIVQEMQIFLLMIEIWNHLLMIETLHFHLKTEIWRYHQMIQNFAEMSWICFFEMIMTVILKEIVIRTEKILVFIISLILLIRIFSFHPSSFSYQLPFFSPTLVVGLIEHQVIQIQNFTEMSWIQSFLVMIRILKEKEKEIKTKKILLLIISPVLVIRIS